MSASDLVPEYIYKLNNSEQVSGTIEEFLSCWAADPCNPDNPDKDTGIIHSKEALHDDSA